MTDDALQRQTIAISAKAHKKVSRVADLTGISRAQIVDHMIERCTIKQLTEILKTDGVTRRPVGRAKQRYHD